MEKIIFFGLVIPIMGYVLYLGGMAIMNGFRSKEANRTENDNFGSEKIPNTTNQTTNLSQELTKLNDLKEKGVISQDEFEKAKNKLLND